MELLDLPEDILFIILRKLDLCSLRNLYEASERIKIILRSQGVIKKCFMSRNLLATASTFKLDFFKDIAYNLVKLNMSGVPDLTKTNVTAAMRKLKHLKVLDVSFTNLDIVDLVDIFKVCPTIKDITINIRSGNEPDNVAKRKLVQCQSVFDNFERVNLVGSLFNILFSNLTLILISGARLNHLTFTIAGRAYSVDESTVFSFIRPSITRYVDKLPCVFPELHQFTIYILNWQKQSLIEPIDKTIKDFPLINGLEWDKFEYVIILVEDLDPKVYTTTLFTDFFKQKFLITAEYAEPTDIKFVPNMVIMFWNKETILFNENFYDTLTYRIKEYFPNYFLLHNETQELSASTLHNWYYTIPSAPIADHAKGKKKPLPKLSLNYDLKFKGKEKFELSLLFKNPIIAAIEIKPNFEYLKKLTYFSLVKFGRYSSDFFNVLFRSCKSLVTLNIEGLGTPPYASAIVRSLPLSKSLKNIRILDKGIDFSTLFTSFSKCSNIENIHIVDDSSLRNDMCDPSILVEKCDQLYSVYLEAEITQTTEVKTVQMFEKAKKRFGKPYKQLKILKRIEESPLPRDGGSYDLFVDVFRLNPIKPT